MTAQNLVQKNFSTIRQWVADQSPLTPAESKHSQQGYSSKTYIYNNNGMKLVLKTPAQSRFLTRLSKQLLKNEYKAYQKLDGIKGIPHCYGFIDDKILVLEYIENDDFCQRVINQSHNFYQQFFLLLHEIHNHGVSHGDLKRKDNILVADNETPYLIDFGTAVISKPGFHPINHFLFNQLKRIDFNAYLKHKYQKNYTNISDEDNEIYRPTIMEGMARSIRNIFKWLLRGFKNF
ncbi:MAG: hypothetical protein V3T17_19665 [Pseudomonadales bacterium]